MTGWQCIRLAVAVHDTGRDEPFAWLARDLLTAMDAGDLLAAIELLLDASGSAYVRLAEFAKDCLACLPQAEILALLDNDTPPPAYGAAMKGWEDAHV